MPPIRIQQLLSQLRAFRARKADRSTRLRRRSIIFAAVAVFVMVRDRRRSSASAGRLFSNG